jgi:hypothetical protein
MILVGRIFDIVIINDKVAQIVLRKKLNDKIVPVAISVFGYYKDKALKDLKLKAKDKIKGNIYLKSKLYNGKYYTDIYFKDIFVVEKAPTNGQTLFDKEEKNDSDDLIMVDKNTGEIFE